MRNRCFFLFMFLWCLSALTAQTELNLACSNTGVCANGDNTGTATVTHWVVLRVTAGANNYEFGAGTAVFGSQVYENILSGQVVYFPDDSTSFFGCAMADYDGQESVAGKVVMVDRGSCFFEEKAYFAQEHGATGVIIVNHTPGAGPMGMGAVNLYTITIPVVSLSWEDGQTLQALVQQNAAVTCTTPSYTYTWSNGATTRSIANLSMGTYTVTATDGGSLTESCSVVVDNQSFPAGIVSSVVGAHCEDQPPVLTASTLGSNIALNGVDQWIDLGGDIADVDLGAFTIEAWIRTTGVGMGIVVTSDNDGDWEAGERVFYIDGAGYPAFVGYGNNYIFGSATVNDGTWHHVAVVRDGDYRKIFIDGNDMTGGVSYGSNNTPNIGTYSIGRPNHFIYEAPNYFSGNLDEVRIWSAARSQAEIQQHMYVSLTSGPSLMASYNMNEGFGGITQNSASPNFTGTLVNGPTWGGVIGNLTYTWSDETTAEQTIAPPFGGTSSVTVTNSSGCTVSDAIVTSGAVSPDVHVDPVAVFCSGEETTVTARGASMHFDGDGDYVDVAPITLNMSNSSFTFEVWVKTTAVSQGIMGFSDNNNYWNEGERVLCIDESGFPVMEGFGMGYIYASVPVNDGQWHHIAAVRNTAGANTIYVDGIDATAYSVYDPYGPDSYGTFNIGKPNYAVGTAYFNGDIDEVRIWNTARTQAELAANMNQQISSSTAGLAGYFRADEGVGASAQGNNGMVGTFQGNTSWANGAPTAYSSYAWSNGATTASMQVSTGGTYTVTVTNPDGCTSVKSVIVESIQLPAMSIPGLSSTCITDSTLIQTNINNNGNYATNYFIYENNYISDIEVPTLPQANAVRTLEAWIKPAFYNSGVVFNWGNTASNQRSGLLVVNGYLYFVGELNDVIGTISLMDGEWHHVAISYDGSNIRLYVDGQLDVTQQIPTLATTGTTLRIGRRAVPDEGENFIGLMDEIRIWDTALTQTQIQNSSLNAVDVSTPGLVANFRFNEGSGSTTAATNPAYVGTLMETTSWAASESNTAAYDFAWSDGSTTSEIWVLPEFSNAYSVTVSAYGCTQTAGPVTIVNTTNEAPLTIAASNGLTLTCNVPNTQLTAGNNPATFNSFTWSTGANTANITVSDGGTYTVTASNGACETITTVVVAKTSGTNVPEVCNGLDDDCDNKIDDADPNTVGEPTWYRDFDKDSYGTPNTTRARCLQPAGYVASNTDCVDNNAAINPAAIEVCNSIDDDCDGAIDDADGNVQSLEWFVDSDNDGYGNPSLPATYSCVQPSGTAGNCRDCNDGNNLINFGRTEITNGIDDDCDGATDNLCANVTTINFVHQSPTRVLLDWTAPNDAVNYNVQFRTVGSLTWSATQSYPNSYGELTGLLPNTNYELRIRTKCGVSFTPYSANMPFTTKPATGICTKPNIGRTEVISSSTARIWWNFTYSAKYGIRYRPTASNTWTIVNTDTATTLQLNKLQAGTAYSYQVRALCSPYGGTNWTTYSSVGTFSTIDKCVATAAPLIAPDNGDIDQLQPMSDLRVQPNPTDGQTLVSWPQDTPAQVELFDLAGRKLATWPALVPNSTIDLTQHTAGIYLLRATFSDGSALHTQVIKL